MAQRYEDMRPPRCRRAMDTVERQVARKLRAMAHREGIVKAIDGQLRWIQVTEIPRLTARRR